MRVRTLLPAMLAGLGLGGVAAAADLPVKTAAPYSPTPVYSADPWTGAYIGIDGGYGWSNGAGDAFAIIPLAEFKTAPQGFVGAGHVGYGQRLNNYLYLGAEGDIAIATMDGTVSMPGLISMTSKNKWMTSLRARFGVIPVGHAMFYGTVGYGWGSGEFTVADVTGATTSVNPTVQGLVWGFGAEVPLTGNWLVRAEYLQYDFNDMQANGTPIGLPPINFKVSDRVDVIRGGVSYHF